MIFAFINAFRSVFRTWPSAEEIALFREVSASAAPVRADMIIRLRFRIFGPPAEIQHGAKTLITAHGPKGAWLAADHKRHLAEVFEAEGECRYWKMVMWDIERQTGYQHQLDTATRMLDR